MACALRMAMLLGLFLHLVVVESADGMVTEIAELGDEAFDVPGEISKVALHGKEQLAAFMRQADELRLAKVAIRAERAKLKRSQLFQADLSAKIKLMSAQKESAGERTTASDLKSRLGDENSDSGLHAENARLRAALLEAQQRLELANAKLDEERAVQQFGHQSDSHSPRNELGESSAQLQLGNQTNSTKSLFKKVNSGRGSGSAARGSAAAPGATPVPRPRFYNGTMGGECPEKDLIHSYEDCKAAMKVLGLRSDHWFKGDSTELPQKCSWRNRNRQNAHWNTGAGKKKSDMIPICRHPTKGWNDVAAEAEKVSHTYDSPKPKDPFKVNRWDTFVASSLHHSVRADKGMPLSLTGKTRTLPEPQLPSGPWADMTDNLYRSVVSSSRFLNYLCEHPFHSSCRRGSAQTVSPNIHTGSELVWDQRACNRCILFKGEPFCKRECKRCSQNAVPTQGSNLCTLHNTAGQAGTYTVAAYAKCKDKAKMRMPGRVQYTYKAVSDQNKKWQGVCKGEDSPTKEAQAEACKMSKEADAYRSQEMNSASDPHECIYSKNPGPEGDYKTVHRCAALVALTWRTCSCPTRTVAPTFTCPSRYEKKYACTNYCTDETGRQAYQTMKTDAVQAVPPGFQEAGYKVPSSCRRWFLELENRWHIHWMNAKKDTNVELAAMACDKVSDKAMSAAAKSKKP